MLPGVTWLLFPITGAILEVKFPQIIEDATQTVEWVKKNISQYGGDSERLFLMGHSAGAQLAALLTLNEHYLLPDT